MGQLKRYFKKTIGRGYLNFYELQTVTYETELLLNSKSLGVLQDDDLEELFTHNHHLYGRQLHFNNHNKSNVVFAAHEWIGYMETVFNQF